MRLALYLSCAVFWTEWRHWWNDLAAYAHSWLRTASEHDKWFCARLLIPHSLLDAVPEHERYRPCSVPGFLQFRAIQGVQGLWRKLVAPTPDLPPSPLWITRFTTRHYTPRETPQNLRNVVGAPSGWSRKRKRSNEHDLLVVGVDTWLQEACQANDTEAVRWFTRTILHQTTTTAHSCKRPRWLRAYRMRCASHALTMCGNNIYLTQRGLTTLQNEKPSLSTWKVQQ